MADEKAVEEELPAMKIVTLVQDESGRLHIVPDDDISKYEVLGMLRIAASMQDAIVTDEEMYVEDEAEVGDADPD